MRRLLISAAIAMLAACAPTMTVAPAGWFQAKGVSVALQNSWTHIPPQLNDITSGSMLTRHGVALGRIDIIRLRPRQSLVRAPSYVEAPRYRAGMSELELVELVTASLQRLEYTDIRAENVRPHQLAGASGVRFDIHGKYPSGLNLRGDAVLAGE